MLLALLTCPLENSSVFSHGVKEPRVSIVQGQHELHENLPPRKITFFKDLLYVSGWFDHIYHISLLHKHDWCQRRSAEGTRHPGNIVTDGCGCWESNPGLLEEHLVLSTTKTFFQARK